MYLASFFTLENLIAVSIIILAAAILIHVCKIRRVLRSINLEELKRRLADLEKRAADEEAEREHIGRNLADVTIRTKSLEHDLAAVQEESGRYLTIFKTVLYGFDYIVQGCKSALEINPGEKRPEEKRINPE